jgi:predicted secreted hydrolase
MDHQWGNFVVASNGGWDWYSLQLDDNTELMLYVLRSASGETTGAYGSQVLADGSVRDLDPGAVQAIATGSWTSPHTGATYPSGWRIDAPGQNLHLAVTPRLQDQELYFPGLDAAGLVYWEGAVDVHGEGSSPSGVGYVELTGYAR